MQLRDYLKIIQKRWWLAAIVTVTAALVAFGYSLAQPKIYETTVTVVGKPAKFDEGLNNAIKSEVRRLPNFLQTPETAARIDQAGRLDLGPGVILEKIKAKDQPDTYSLLITVSDTDPARAAKIANAAADYIHDYELEQVATTPDDSKVFFDKTSRAGVPDRPSTPRTNLNMAAGGALGLVLGLILIFIVEFFDSTIRTEEDVERFTGLNVLGVIPAWRPSHVSTRNKIRAAYPDTGRPKPATGEAEAGEAVLE